MGLDFRPDNTPKFYMREHTSDTPPVMGPWREIESWEAYSKIEDAEYTERVYEVRVEPVPRVSIPSVHWAYSGFGRFRERLWTATRKPEWPEELAMMNGFRPMTGLGIYRLRTGREMSDLDLKQFEPGEYKAWQDEQNTWWQMNAVAWDSLGEYALADLINHSDCDGDLSPDQCRTVAPALREAIAEWDDDDDDKQMGLALADAMDTCAESSRRLIFC